VSQNPSYGNYERVGRDVTGLSLEDIRCLYELHARAVLIFLTRRTCDAEIALDLLGETFAQAVLRRSSLRGQRDEVAKAWLFGIARRQLAQYYRRGRVERAALRRLGLEPPAAPEEELRRVEELAGVADLREALSGALEALSAEQRLALQLRVVDGQPYPEVATALGVSEQTARARVSRALRALRGALDRDDLKAVVSVD
jgi:RNA polymerase sigma factor (sigma-70 family)